MSASPSTAQVCADPYGGVPCDNCGIAGPCLYGGPRSSLLWMLLASLAIWTLIGLAIWWLM